MLSQNTPRKRLFKEVEALADLEPINMHGAILSISPVKKEKSSKYFEGLLSDSNARSPRSSRWIQLRSIKETYTDDAKEKNS